MSDKIEKRLREWAATLWDRELDDEDKSNLFDDLTQAADEIESLSQTVKEAACKKCNDRRNCTGCNFAEKYGEYVEVEF